MQPPSSEFDETRYESENKSISNTNRNLCRTLKMLIFVSCLTGFGYQTTEFLTNFYTYPTVINMDVKRMDEFPIPALTFCSRYLYNFKKYCKMYPANCEKPKHMKSFCRDQPHKCKASKTSAVTPKEFPTLRAVNGWKAIKKVTFNTSEAFVVVDDKYFEGPFYSHNTPSGYEVCFRTGNGFGPSGLRTTPKVGTRTFKWTTFGVSFIQDNNIFFSRDAEPYGTLYIHSPFLSFRKSSKSIILRTHMYYTIYIRLEQERLLPYPYESDCVDYEALWRNNNKNGPVSREMCEYICKSEDGLYFEQNSDRNTYLEEMCISALESNSSLTSDEKDKCNCISRCKDECLKLNYDFSYEERKGLWVDEENTRDFRRAYTNIIIEKDNVRVLSYKPQYMDVEVFSYIGGFIGCWLGISLWTSTGMLWRGYSAFRSNVKEYRKRFGRSSKNITNKY